MPSTLTVGSTGREVGELHQALVEAGLPVAVADLSTTTYGASTANCVASYQASHGFVADGVCGPGTWESLLYADKNAIPTNWKIGPTHKFIAPVIAKAVDLVGTAEVPPGSNRSELIDAWNKSAGLPLGRPWCASFATNVYAACPKNPYKIPLGSAYKLHEWGKKNKSSILNIGTAIAGDIFVILRGDAHGHVGIVTADLGSSVATIEGNVGNSVKKLIRKKEDLTVFVRPLGIGLTV